MIPRLELPLGLSTHHQVAAPSSGSQGSESDRSRQPASISSFLSSIGGSLVSRIPSLVIKFHIYKKKIIISKYISPPGGEPNLTTKLFNQVPIVQEKGSFDRDNSICRSPDSTPACSAFMSS